MDTDLKELDPCIDALDQAITNIGETLDPILRVPTDELKATLSPLQKAKLDVISLYAVNSLFWVYLKTKGVNPTTQGLPDELNRVKEYMKKVKEFEDRKLAPTVNRDASKRVMRNALWSAAHKPKTSKTANGKGSTMIQQHPPGAAYISNAKDDKPLKRKKAGDKKHRRPKKKQKGTGN